MVRRIGSLLVGVIFLLTACAPTPTLVTSQPTSTVIPTGLLTPYHTQTPTAIRPTATILVTIPVTPTLTPTPFLHTIAKDDTMLGLAFRYGVKLEDLKTANPAINPNAMSVGTQLVIPISTEIPEAVPTPTAVPVNASQPRCTRTGDGGAWCIVGLRNDMQTSLENLSVWVGLYTPQGNIIMSQVAYAPLNILRPGSTMPLMVYFSPPLPDDFTARSELLTASTVAADDNRYLDVQVKTDMVEVSSDGSQAEVSGEVLVPAVDPSISQVWVLVVAYDAGENILGVRKWKSPSETHFETTVYSLGGVIDHIEILTEVRP